VALPPPERGLVVSYACLWQSEHARGREAGIKARPCVIILAVERAGGVRVVTVVPITHAAPTNPDEAVEIALTTKRRPGLDEARSWISVSEANRFVWPGPDLYPIAAGRFHYGFMPPALFRQVQERMGRYVAARRLLIVPRTE